ncbi:hypothetical protein Tco_1258144, partial [Tanacetum coccineum]
PLQGNLLEVAKLFSKCAAGFNKFMIVVLKGVGLILADFENQLKQQKIKKQEKKTKHDAEKAKEDLVTKKRQREERRHRYRTQDKLQKKMRRD